MFSLLYIPNLLGIYYTLKYLYTIPSQLSYLLVHEVISNR